MENEKDTSPLFDLIKLGKGGEKNAEQSAAGKPPATEDAGSNRADADGRGRNLPPLQTRGGELTIKYDLAMLVLLALAGMIVIAYMWGHYSGREVGREEIRDLLDKNNEPKSPDSESEKRGAASGQVAKDFYSLRIMSDPAGFSQQRKAQYEMIKAKYKMEGYEPEIAIGPDDGIILYVGRYPDKDSDEAKTAFAYFSNKPEFRSCKWEIRRRE